MCKKNFKKNSCSPSLGNISLAKRSISSETEVVCCSKSFAQLAISESTGWSQGHRFREGASSGKSIKL